MATSVYTAVHQLLASSKNHPFILEKNDDCLPMPQLAFSQNFEKNVGLGLYNEIENNPIAQMLLMGLNVVMQLFYNHNCKFEEEIEGLRKEINKHSIGLKEYTKQIRTLQTKLNLTNQEIPNNQPFQMGIQEQEIKTEEFITNSEENDFGFPDDNNKQYFHTSDFHPSVFVEDFKKYDTNEYATDDLSRLQNLERADKSTVINQEFNENLEFMLDSALNKGLSQKSDFESTDRRMHYNYENIQKNKNVRKCSEEIECRVRKRGPPEKSKRFKIRSLMKGNSASSSNQPEVRSNQNPNLHKSCEEKQVCNNLAMGLLDDEDLQINSSSQKDPHLTAVTLPNFSHHLEKYLNGEVMNPSTRKIHRKQLVDELLYHLQENQIISNRNRGERSWLSRQIQSELLFKYPNIHKEESHRKHGHKSPLGLLMASVFEKNLKTNKKYKLLEKNSL